MDDWQPVGLKLIILGESTKRGLKVYLNNIAWAEEPNGCAAKTS